MKKLDKTSIAELAKFTIISLAAIIPIISYIMEYINKFSVLQYFNIPTSGNISLYREDMGFSTFIFIIDVLLVTFVFFLLLLADRKSLPARKGKLFDYVIKLLKHHTIQIYLLVLTIWILMLFFRQNVQYYIVPVIFVFYLILEIFKNKKDYKIRFPLVMGSLFFIIIVTLINIEQEIPDKTFELISFQNSNFLVIQNDRDFIIVKEYNEGDSLEEIANRKEFRKMSTALVQLDIKFNTIKFSKVQDK